MHLGEHGHVERHGQVLELVRLLVGEGCEDEEDGVGAHRARLEDLPRVDREVLAEHGQVAGQARKLEVPRLALEPFAVREHGQARRPRLAVGARQAGRVEGLADQAGGGRGALDLGDQPRAALAQLGAERAEEIARSVLRQRLALHLGERHARLALAHLLALGVEDAGERVGRVGVHGRVRPRGPRRPGGRWWRRGAR